MPLGRKKFGMPARHIVLCTVRTDLSAEAIRQAFAPLAALRGRIPGLIEFSSGFGTSPDGGSQPDSHSHPPHGPSQHYNYAIVMDFANAVARDAYLHDPRHHSAVEAIGPAASRNRTSSSSTTTLPNDVTPLVRPMSYRKVGRCNVERRPTRADADLDTQRRNNHARRMRI